MNKIKLNTLGKVVSANEDTVVVKIDADGRKYKKGQIVVATVSSKEKTLRGKTVIVSDVVAQGPIKNIIGNRVTICTNRNNPIVSRKAAMDARKAGSLVKVKILE